MRGVLVTLILAGAMSLTSVDADSAGEGRQAATWNEVYVWQRSWTPTVSNATLASADLVGGWRILAMEIEADGRQILVQPAFDALVGSGLPVTAVIRLDGRMETLDVEGIPAAAASLVERWRASGVRPSIEIDFDCATARLALYAELLTRVRKALPRDVRLSVTALPAWLSSPALTRLLSIPDEIVLQVHAVRDPRFGLFDPQLASRWVTSFAARSPRPFRVALPTYGAKITMRGDKIASVESEVDGLSGSDEAFEITADPREVTTFARRLREQPVDGLAGIVWFRLPVAGDRRAWSAATWRSVLTGSPAPYRPRIRVEPQPNGARLIVAENDSAVDALPPRRVSFAGACPTDGANGYERDDSRDRPSLVNTRQALLRSNERRVIGWTRCPVDSEALHVED